MTHPLTVFVER